MKLSCVKLEELLSLAPEEKWELVCGGIKDEGISSNVSILLGSRPQRAIERALAAAELYRSGRTKCIIASGGVKWEYQGEELTEAELMKRVLIENGVPEEAILLDNEARTTIENMICSTLVISRNLKITLTDSVIIVTSLNHMKRSLALAKALLPRCLSISGYPALPRISKEEWLSDEENVKSLNSSLKLIKQLVDHRVIDDVEISL